MTIYRVMKTVEDKFTHKDSIYLAKKLWNTESIDGSMAWSTNHVSIKGRRLYGIITELNRNTGKSVKYIGIGIISTRTREDLIYVNFTDLSEYDAPDLETRDFCPAYMIHELGGINGIEDEAAREWRKINLEKNDRTKQMHTSKRAHDIVTFEHDSQLFDVIYNWENQKWQVVGEQYKFFPRNAVNIDNIKSF